MDGYGRSFWGRNVKRAGASLASVLNLDASTRQLMRAGFTSMALRFFGLACGYLFSFFLARKEGAEAVGGFAIYFTVLAVAVVLGKAGTDMTLLRFISDLSGREDKNALRRIYLKGLAVVAVVCLALSLALLLSSRTIAVLVFNKEDFTDYLNLVAVSILPASLIIVNAECLRAMRRIGAYAFFQMASNWILATLFLLVAVQYVAGAQAAIFAYLGAVLLTCALSFIFWYRLVWRNLPGGDGGSTTAPSTKRMLSISIPILVSGVAFMVLTMTDTLMLGVFGTDADVGVYNICIKMVGLAAFTLMAVNSLAAPRFAESYGKQDIGDIQETVLKATRLAFWSSSPIFLVLFLFPAFLLGIFGSEFSRGSGALLILALGQMVNVMAGAVAYILQMTGRERGFLGISITAAGLNVFLNLVLIPRFGIGGAAAASASSLIFWNLACVAYAWRSLRVLTIYIPFMTEGVLTATGGAVIIDESLTDEQEHI